MAGEVAEGHSSSLPVQTRAPRRETKAGGDLRGKLSCCSWQLTVDWSPKAGAGRIRGPLNTAQGDQAGWDAKAGRLGDSELLRGAKVLILQRLAISGNGRKCAC